MLTEVMSKLDRAVLELALVDAFTDMCFYEGEEFTAELESYLKDVENKTNTEEQDTKFFELSMPYIEHSVMKYGATILESIKEGGKPGKFAPNDSKGTVGITPAEKTKLILGKDSRAAYDAKDSKLTEAEEIAVWEGLGGTIYPAVKKGVTKAQTMLVTTGNKLSNVAKSGLLATQKKLSGFKLAKSAKK